MWCQKMFYSRNNIYNKSIPTSQKTSEFQLFFNTKKPKCFMSYHCDRERLTRFFILVKLEYHRVKMPNHNEFLF